MPARNSAPSSKAFSSARQVFSCLEGGRFYLLSENLHVFGKLALAAG